MNIKIINRIQEVGQENTIKINNSNLTLTNLVTLKINKPIIINITKE